MRSQLLHFIVFRHGLSVSGRKFQVLYPRNTYFLIFLANDQNSDAFNLQGVELRLTKFEVDKINKLGHVY